MIPLKLVSYNIKMQSNKKISVGILLCRHVNGAPEVLMVKSRLTHPFNEFVFGKYKTWNHDVLQDMFNRMSTNEKLFLLGMDFDKIWHYIWLRVHTPRDNTSYDTPRDSASREHDKNMYSFYQHCRNRFEKFTRDGGQRLRTLIYRSTSAEPGWEIPKGRREHLELDVDCAIREFREETNIPVQCYSVLWNVDPIVLTYQTDNNSIYHNRYYVGVLNREYENTPLQFDFQNHHQAYEITALKWFRLHDLNYVPLQTSMIYGLVKRGLAIYKKYRRSIEVSQQ